MLKKRLQTAIPLIGFLILAFFLPGLSGKILFTLFALLMLLFAIREGFQLTAPKTCRPSPALVYGLALVANAMIWQNPDQLNAMLVFDNIITALFIFAAFALTFRKTPDKDILKNIFTCLALGLYICWPLSYIPKTYAFFQNGPRLLFAMIVICKMADIGGYFIGSTTSKLPGGNHKICRAVSPGKSWEGLFGGIIFSSVAVALFHYSGYADQVFSTASIWILGIAMPLIGLLGDLAESVIKRAVNVKDSGNVPGLGGILDMLDSLIPCAPFFFYYLLFTLGSTAPVLP